MKSSTYQPSLAWLLVSHPRTRPWKPERSHRLQPPVLTYSSLKSTVPPFPPTAAYFPTGAQRAPYEPFHVGEAVLNTTGSWIHCKAQTPALLQANGCSSNAVDGAGPAGSLGIATDFSPGPRISASQLSTGQGINWSQFLGRWYSAGLASNSSWFREKKAVISMCKTVIAPSTDGGLNLTSTFLRKNQCETKIMLLQPVGLPGHYKYNSPHWGSVHTVLVMETNYNEYALLFSRGTKGPGQDFRMATLYSRSTTPKDKLKKKFINFSKSMGLTEEDIVFLPQPDKCIQE